MTKKITILVLALLICASSVYAGDMRMTTINLSYSATKSLVPYARGVTYYLMTATGNCAFSMYGGVTGDSVIFLITSDAVGGHVMTFSTNMTPTGIMTLIANQTSVIQFIYTGTTFKESYRIDGNSRPILPFSTQGDILYASATNTWTNLAKSATATRYLANTGTDNNPAWNQVNLTNGVSGTLPIANGGTGSTVGNITIAIPSSDSTYAGCTVIPLIANENQAFGDLCYIDTDGEAHIGDGDAESTSRIVVVCVSSSVTAGNSGNYALIDAGGILYKDSWNWSSKGILLRLSTTGTTGNTWSESALSGTDDANVIVAISLTAKTVLLTRVFVVEMQ